MKFKLLSISTVVLLLLVSCGDSNDDTQVEEQETEAPFVVKKENLIVGSTLNLRQLNTPVEKLYLDDGFKYLTPANAAKQQIVKRDNKESSWDWSWIDAHIAFAKKHNLEIRVHGPISPQVSEWTREDIRTAEELEKNMTDFLIASCKKYNVEPTIKWMDVVNETITTTGEYNPNKPGTDAWEVPFYKMGLDQNGYPNYILKAFQLATEHAPNIKLVYNQNGGLQDALWDKLKKTVLYIRSKGHRVDGIGWQGHINYFNKNVNGILVDPEETVQKLSDLIDWAHANNLEFHITEIDYQVRDNKNFILEVNRQALAYKRIVEVLESKTATGVVTLNLWDMTDRLHPDKGTFISIYDENLKPRPSHKVIKAAFDNSKHSNK
ncbi:Endo-1,4-beta-xylanase, GH35 family [Lutibacter agarilyticus]|uniref:endo-1,4-beta-xylanase n=1 Tax=Lutibacter agarilyticus TaxID=1109740 RepID=A0A238Z5I7_9FLAO|nr:endo-1,4-beta-xylanase [Lutibacter agarilyticus]SNR78238.1 Endo-1,4-beta-xylanase, GH35 family [Lutibacter agarilyticus]